MGTGRISPVFMQFLQGAGRSSTVEHCTPRVAGWAHERNTGPSGSQR
ncbi:hypothetical protein ACFFX0_22180 [Citricoccus parietis]|uniref:Uncharacterized protein n=1 Tax=Citricoccus parietis TaxID=592307 RepID=A0ABV5G4B0_9MICC